MATGVAPYVSVGVGVDSSSPSLAHFQPRGLSPPWQSKPETADSELAMFVRVDLPVAHVRNGINDGISLGKSLLGLFSTLNQSRKRCTSTVCS